MLVVPAAGAGAQAQDVSGSVDLGNSLQYGNTSYTVSYSYPSTAEVGNNFTIALTLHVNAFTGLVEYITNYGFVAEVFINGLVLQGTVSGNENLTLLYPGSSWGPNNVTIPLTENNTGLAKGESANATVSVTLQDTVYYGGQQLNVYVTEPRMQGHAGGFLVSNAVSPVTSSNPGPGAGSSYLPYAALTVVGAALVLWAAVWPRRPESPNR